MKLITEEISNAEYIVEETNGKKNYAIKGVFMQSDVKNRNGRIYPKEILQKEVARYNREFIQKNRNNKDELLVRSRIKGDIEKFFPDSDVFEMENSDYKYRSFIKKTDVSSKLKNIVEEINYDNFKNSISPDQSERHNSYLNVWTELRKLQK